MPHDTDLLTFSSFDFKLYVVRTYVRLRLLTFSIILLPFLYAYYYFRFLFFSSFHLFSLSLAPAGTSGKSLGMWIEEIGNFFHLLSHGSTTAGVH